jgi:hypothetical protein
VFPKYINGVSVYKCGTDIINVCVMVHITVRFYSVLNIYCIMILNVSLCVIINI